jgi:hypothetical protein
MEKQEVVLNVRADIPLSEFILGYWESVSVSHGDEKESMNSLYELEFVDSDTLKFVFNNEGYTLQSNFVNSNEIFVDNKRITGGEHWRLERNNQTLIVHCTIVDKTSHIVFERQQGRMSY